MERRMIDYTGFRQPGGPGAPSQRSYASPLQQRGQLPYSPPMQSRTPFDLSAAGGGGPMQQRPSVMQYSRPGQGGMPMQMGGPGQFGGGSPTVNNPYQMGIPQYPVGNKTGMPQWMTQNPYQMGQPQWPGMQNPYQMGRPQWPGMQQRNPFQMGQPQWPGMQQRQPMTQQQSPWGMPGRY